MKYVLLILWLGGSGADSVAVEFNSLDACESARSIVVSDIAARWDATKVSVTCLGSV